MVKKKNKLILTWVIIILILSVVTYFGYNAITQQAIVNDCIGGLTVNSISNALVTNSENLNGRQAIRLTVTANQRGECAEIIFDKDAINQKLATQGFGISKSVFLDVVSVKQQQTFSIQPTNQQIFKVGKQGVGYNPFATKSWCDQKLASVGLPQTTFLASPGLFTSTDCYYYGVAGNVGQFGTISIRDFKVGFKSSDGNEAVVESGIGSAKVGSNIFVKWNGDLASQIQVGSLPYDSVSIGGDWRVTRDAFYDSITARKNDLNTCIKNRCAEVFICTEKTFETACIDPYNNYVDQNTVSLISELQSSNRIIDTATISGTNLVLTFSEPISFPTFVVDVDAQFVGIFQLIGKPDVTCPADLTINSGEQSTANLDVKNIGQNNAVFVLKLTCDGNERQVSPLTVSLPQGQSQVVTGTITETNRKSVTGEESITKSCTFIATDPNSLNQDTCKFDVNVKSVETCIPGKTICSEDLDDVLVCNQDGKSYSTQAKCDFGCENVGGESKCRTSKGAEEICTNGIDDDNDGLIDTKDPDCLDDKGFCQNKVSLGSFTILPDFSNKPATGLNKLLGKDTEACMSISQTIGFWGGIIAFFLILIFGTLKISDLLRKNRDLRKSATLIAFILSLLLGIIGYILSLNLLIYGLIIALIIGILFIFLQLK